MRSNQIDEANGPIAKHVQCVCHGTLPWLISFSLDLVQRPPVQSDSELARRTQLRRRVALIVLIAVWVLAGLFMRAGSSGSWPHLWVAAPFLIVFAIIVGPPLWG